MQNKVAVQSCHENSILTATNKNLMITMITIPTSTLVISLGRLSTK